MNSFSWQPSASLSHLQQRAKITAQIRAFFASRDVLEVETPLLAQYSVTDPYMDAFELNDADASMYLQTSPEYAMKRLLAAGSGSIFQICKAFRQGEQGSRHNPEFTILEWYRLDFDHWQLMDEVAQLIATVLPTEPPVKLSYRDVFLQYLGVDPHSIALSELQPLANSHLDIQMDSNNRDDWLNLLMAQCIEPKLGFDHPVFIYDYPASQSALAKLATNEQGQPVAQRFELYINGVELANGYHELTSAHEQSLRFQKDRELRREMNRPDILEDTFLSSAMGAGLPACAGVALGLDRLIMLALGVSSIDDVIAFPIARA